MKRPGAWGEKLGRGPVAWGPLGLAVAVQALGLLAAVYIIVSAPARRAPPAFAAGKKVYLTPPEIEHRISLEEYRGAARTAGARLRTSALLPDGMPALPDLAPAELDPLKELAPGAEVLLAPGLMGDWMDTAAPSSFSFFGLEDETERLVIAFDISASVKNKAEKSGVPLSKIKDETARLIRQLNANTLFGLAQFSRKYDLFQPALVPATVKNREAALRWLEKEFRTDGRSGSGWTGGQPNGIQCVMKAVLELGPDVVVLISDGSFQRNRPDGGGENVPWADLEKTLREAPNQAERKWRLHFAGFEVKPADAAELKALARRWRGNYKEIRGEF